MSDAPEEQEQEQYYEWSAYYDDEGRLYYYNATTEESSWDEPAEGYNPPPPPDDNDNVEKHQNDEPVATAGDDDDNNNDEGPQSPINYPQSPDEPPASPENYPQSPKESPVASPRNYPHSPDDEQPHSPSGGSIGSPTQPTSPASNYPGSPDQPGSPENYPGSPDQDDDDGMPQSPSNPPEGDDNENENDNSAIVWIAYKDEEGNEYYYNNETGDTQWEKPDRYMTAEEYEALAGGDDVNDKEGKADDVPQDDESMDDDEEVKLKQEEDNEVEPEIDPEIIKVQNAEEALQKPDSILEPNCIANVRIVVSAHNGKPEKAIKSLLESYHGQTAICGLLARWFIDFKQQTTTTTTSAEATTSNSKGSGKNNNNNDKQQYSEADADYIRGIAQDVINRIANERFTREAGDEILDLGKSDAAFLEEMMDSVRWRKLLIDLSASHKDSAVLLYCLRAISKRGHHREIAKRINQSDHFAVFNAMLLSELAVVGCTAVSAGSDINSSSGFDDLLNDLQRACSATSYTYLYSVEMLRTLVATALNEAEKDTDRAIEDCRFHRAVRKWQALIQLLENAMVDPAAAPAIAGTSPLIRKRRLDVALTISELHQRQRRRILNTDTEQVDGEAINYQPNNTNTKGNDDPKDLENAMLMLLRRYSTGTQIGDAVLDKLLPIGVDMNTRGVGKLLLNHPLSIRALLGHMYKPGTTRINAIGTKNKCARLVALAVLAAEEMTRDEIRKHRASTESNNRDGTEDEIDEVALTRMIVQGSQLCEQIEAMISFSVTTDSQPGMGTISPGQKLCVLALKCTPVGIGVMMWAREFTQGTEFPQSASFPTISPNIMSLVRLIAMKHPFTRHDALHIALAFLRHANPDISYQKINALKEQALRLMVCLLIKGDVAPVLTSITNLLSKTGSELDASLVRYFVGGVVEAVAPPFSPVFVRLFSSLLKASRTIDAVRSTYFATDSKKKLGTVLRAFKATKRSNGTVLSGDDAALVSSLLTTYQIE